MYRNTVNIYKGDRLNLQSDMSFFHATNSAFYGKYVRKAVLFISRSGNEVQLRVYKMRKENIANFGQFISVNVKKMLRKLRPMKRRV